MSDLGSDVTRMIDSAEQVVRYLAGKFGFTDVGGWRASDPFPDHPGGYAADFMIKTSAQGNQLADFAVSNAQALGVDYVIWNRKVWDADKDTAGLPYDQRRAYTGTSNPHTDHVHITFRKNATPTVGGLSTTPLGFGAGDIAGSLFDIDGLMDKIRNMSVTLLAAGLGVALVGVGVVVSVRSSAKRAIDSRMSEAT